MKHEQVGKLFRVLMAPVRAMHQQCERCAAGPGRATEICFGDSGAPHPDRRRAVAAGASRVRKAHAQKGADRDGYKQQTRKSSLAVARPDVSGLTATQTLCCNLVVSLLAATQGPERPRPRCAGRVGRVSVGEPEKRIVHLMAWTARTLPLSAPNAPERALRFSWWLLRSCYSADKPEIKLWPKLSLTTRPSSSKRTYARSSSVAVTPAIPTSKAAAGGWTRVRIS